MTGEGQSREVRSEKVRISESMRAGCLARRENQLATAVAIRVEAQRASGGGSVT